MANKQLGSQGEMRSNVQDQPPVVKIDRANRTSRQCVHLLILTTIFVFLLLLCIRSSSWNSTSFGHGLLSRLGLWNHSIKHGPSTDFPHDLTDLFTAKRRISLNHNRVACWPSTGGMWVKSLTAVEMAFLGLERFGEVCAAYGTPEEDVFCSKLRSLGADWYRNPSFDPILKMRVEVAYPENGGIWVLHVGDSWNQFEPEALGLSRALTMQERCIVIERLG